MLISIIIPVFNVAEHLRQCLESVLNQNFADFELLLVNDGSTDGSPAICDEFASRDVRVTVIHQDNKGVSAARNAGIDAARGKYLLFIDGDDFIGENSLENLAAIAGDTDVIFLGVARYFGDGKTGEVNAFDRARLYKKPPGEALEYISSLSDFTTSVCLKLIKRELCGNFAGYIWGEDTDFCVNLYLRAQTFDFCSGYTYFYRKGREGSATYSFTARKLGDLLAVIEKWLKSDYAKTHADFIYNFFAFQFCLAVSGYGKLPSSSKRGVNVKKYAWLLSKSRDRRVRLVGFVYKIFGLRVTSFLYRLYERGFS